jgi:rfaE bifunctional protein kinase chain/domain
MYAKHTADILIASITCDAHIKKANVRPFISEDLRALNLAALEMVDYVYVDSDEKPLKTLADLQPDYFAKGYEYISGTMNPKTQEELDVINAYGGEIIFTPGDVVYSSSAIIENAPPQLSQEKLRSLLEGEHISLDDIRQAFDKFKGIRVHVIGDTIVDTYTYTTMIGGQTKTPTLSVRQDTQDNYVGGAGIVAKHLKAAGADVTFSTVLGDDAWKDFVLKDLEEFGVKVLPIIDETRPTTNKNAIICEAHRLLKLDTLDNRVVSDKICKILQNQIKNEPTDCIIFSDFRHGIFSSSTIPAFIESIPPNVFKVADSQVASRWGNILDFKGFDLITPNEREARFSLGDQDSVVRPLALHLFKAAQCNNLILKLGERGILVYRNRLDVDTDLRSFFIVDSFADKVLDAVGAGDALLAYATLAHIVTGNEVIAGVLGSLAAAVECEHLGNVPVTQKEVVDKISRLEIASSWHNHKDSVRRVG